MQEKEKEAALPKMRIVSYFGDWICECGRQNRLWDTCKCQKAGPCRDWVRGRCKYGDECRCRAGPRTCPLVTHQDFPCDLFLPAVLWLPAA